VNNLQVIVPRGVAPQFHRVLKVELPNKPNLPEVEKPPKFTPSDLAFFVANAVRLPVSHGAFLRTYPPLVLLDAKTPSAVVLQAENFNFGEPLSMDISVGGPMHGNGMLHVVPRNSSVEKIELKPAAKEMMALKPDEDGFIHGTIELHVKNERRKMPIVFLQPPTSGTLHYRCDFDRDGADEWVLENADLRLIVSPESGGQAIALVHKISGANLSTSVGLLRDAFSRAENPQGTHGPRARGRNGLFNRAYSAEWQTDAANPALRLQYDAPDTLPAGAHVEKNIRFEGPSTLRVNYRIALNAVKGDAGRPLDSPPQSFVVLNSFPASGESERGTHFCWPTTNASAGPAASSESSDQQSQKLQCEDFTPGGKTIHTPEGATHVVVETTGRPTISIEWECAKKCARMTIEPKNFSALFRLEFPGLTPGGDAAEYTLRIRTTASP
jgi:hypothetical protein